MPTKGDIPRDFRPWKPRTGFGPLALSIDQIDHGDGRLAGEKSINQKANGFDWVERLVCGQLYEQKEGELWKATPHN